MPFSKGVDNEEKGAENGFALNLLANCTLLNYLYTLETQKKSKKMLFPSFY